MEEKSLSAEKYKLLEEAWKYQDFITEQLLKIGISVNAYQSVFYQMKYGESASGIEIKNDRQMSKTGNVYIEFNQTTLRGTTNRDSGIKMKDDSWLYIIGDFQKFFIFGKNQLRSLLDKVQKKPKYYWENYHIRVSCHKNENGDITSNGLVIPVQYIEENNLAIKTMEVNENGK